MLFTTFCAATEITETVYEHQLAANTYLLSGVASTTLGTDPTG